MRYFKIPLCRIFPLKIRDQSGQIVYECRVKTARVSDILGQKLGYDTIEVIK